MGNYISIIIGCVGAVELITFLHQFSMRADEEHDRELQEAEGRSSNYPSAGRQATKSANESGNTTVNVAPDTPCNSPASEDEVVKSVAMEEMCVKREAQASERELSPRRILQAPEIRFELYERSSSLTDVDRPFVDGLKIQRPLVRDDGSGRRKSVKKRNSSGNIEAKLSREEELRMFTSLEEEEFNSLSEGSFVPISYGSSASDSSTTIKTPRRQRRYKRSPVKEANEETSSSREALPEDEIEDQVDESITHPWGDIKPQHRRDKHHLVHERSMSIEELQEDEERLSNNDEVIAAAIENVSMGIINSVYSRANLECTCY